MYHRFNSCAKAGPWDPGSFQSSCTHPSWHWHSAFALWTMTCIRTQTRPFAAQQKAAAGRTRCTCSTPHSTQSQNRPPGQRPDPDRSWVQWSGFAYELRWQGSDCRWAGQCPWAGSRCRFRSRQRCRLVWWGGDWVSKWVSEWVVWLFCCVHSLLINPDFT